MRRSFLTCCLYLFGVFWALSILGCAPTLESLHVLHPTAQTYEVCRAPLKAPPGTKFFAYRRSIDRIWWDADLDSLKAFIKHGVDGIYEVVPNAPAKTAKDLPPPYDGLTCGSTPITSKNEHRAPPSIVVAIDDALFAELVDDIAAAKKASRPDPRYVGQQVDGSPDQTQLRATISQSLTTGTVVASTEDESHPVTEFVAGFGAGLSISFVPMGSVGADIAIRTGALKPGTKAMRLGKDLAQLASGIGQIFVGSSGVAVGAGATSTGGGAPAGVVVIVKSAAIVTNGLANVYVSTVDAIDLALHVGDDAIAVPAIGPSPSPAPVAATSPPAAAPPVAPKSTVTPAPAPKPAPKPAAAAKPAAPQQTPSTQSARLGSGKVTVGPTGNVTRTWVRCTGQVHHAISKKIYKALENHDTLKGIYKYRDPEFVTQAINKQAHNGYQKWHIEMEKKVVDWLRANQLATPAAFTAFLKNLYATDQELIRRFPNGL